MRFENPQFLWALKKLQKIWSLGCVEGPKTVISGASVTAIFLESSSFKQLFFVLKQNFSVLQSQLHHPDSSSTSPGHSYQIFKSSSEAIFKMLKSHQALNIAPFFYEIFRKQNKLRSFINEGRWENGKSLKWKVYLFSCWSFMLFHTMGDRVRDRNPKNKFCCFMNVCYGEYWFSSSASI